MCAEMHYPASLYTAPFDATISIEKVDRSLKSYDFLVEGQQQVGGDN
jgi:hypothetical protein